MSEAINLLIGWNPNKDFLCVVCGLPFGEPISHLKMHMTQTDFRCIDCDVKCGELKAGYDSFVNHVEQTRHLNYQFTCMQCNISETDFPKHMRHLQMHNDEDPRLHDIKTESDAKKHSVNLGEDPRLSGINLSNDQRLYDIKTEDDDGIKEGSSITDFESVLAEVTEVKPVQLQGCYEVVDPSEMINKLPTTAKEGSNKFQCFVCCMLVPLAEQNFHMSMHLNDTTVQIERKSGKLRFICKLCKLTSDEDHESIQNHMKFHKDMAKYPMVRKNGKQPLYYFDTCRICKEQHTGPASLFDHVLGHFPNSLFYCRVCFELYNDYQSCRDHFNSHELEVNTKTTFGVYFLCPGCGYLEIPNNPSKIIKHLTRLIGCACGNDSFECKRITANLQQFEHCCLKFNDTINSCNFKCDDAVSLCSHVLQHIVSNEVANIGDTGRKELKIHSRLENDSKEIVPSVVKIESPFLNSDGQRTFTKASVVQESVRRELKIHSRLENDSKETVVKIESSLLNSDGQKTCSKTFRKSLSPRESFHDFMIPNNCVICGTNCVTVSDLFEHVLNHFPGNVFYCRGCFKTFSIFMWANHHSIEHVECGVPLSYNGNETGVLVVFVCSICGYSNVCNQKEDIISHLLQHNKKTADMFASVPRKGAFVCGNLTAKLLEYKHCRVVFDEATYSCDFVCDNASSLHSHVQQHVEGLGQSNLRSDGKSYVQQHASGLCHICGKMCLSEDHLFDHILCHFPGTAFYCRICFSSYKDFKTCKQHYVAHKGMTRKESAYGIYLLCPVCGELETPDPTWKILRHLYRLHLDSPGCNWKNRTFISNPRKGAFVCRNLTAKLSGFEHSVVVFDEITCSCDFECDDASTLNSHFQQHTLYYKRSSMNTQTSPSTCTLQANDAKQSELCQYSLPKTDDQMTSLNSMKAAEQQTSWSDVNLLSYAKNEVLLLQNYYDSMMKKLCIICGVKSKTVSDFYRHVFVHFPDNIFYCRLCFKTFRNFLSADNHSRQHYASTRPTNVHSTETSKVGFVCCLCGHNDFSNRSKFIIAHLFQHHDQAKDPGFSPPQKHLLCKCISASLMCYQHFLGEFESATVSCEEKFDNIGSLCDHVQQHIVKFKSKTERKDSESSASTDPTASEEVLGVKHEEVDPPCDMPSGRRAAVKFGEMNTSDITSQLSVEQCDVAEVDIKDERDRLWQNTTVALNAIKEEKMETLESNDKESRQRAELMDFNSATSATTSQKVSQMPSGDISVPYSSRLGKISPALTVNPSGCTGIHKPDKPKLSADFATGVSGNSKRTFNAAFIAENHYVATKEIQLDAFEEKERKQITGKSKIKIFVCKVCGKRFIAEHFLKKHMTQH